MNKYCTIAVHYIMKCGSEPAKFYQSIIALLTKTCLGHFKPNLGCVFSAIEEAA